MEKFGRMVEVELFSMKAIGMMVPEAAIAMTKDDELMKEYENMTVSDCADLLVSLAMLK